jgi:aldehyde:ferredoxin oxidoreductase
MVARIMDFRAMTNSLILCHFEDVVIPDLLTLIESVTSWQWSVEDLRTTATRIFELKRLINARLGMTPADDALPQRILKAYEDGPAAGYAPDLATMLRHYYAARQWDLATGVARPERLAELGLDKLF